MSVTNTAIAELLQQYAGVIAAEGALTDSRSTPIGAAESVEHCAGDVAAMVKRGEDVRQLPGVGNAIRGVVEEIVRSGKLERLTQTMGRSSQSWQS